MMSPILTTVRMHQNHTCGVPCGSICYEPNEPKHVAAEPKLRVQQANAYNENVDTGWYDYDTI